MMKRMMSVVLVFCLLLSLIPSTAFAANEGSNSNQGGVLPEEPQRVLTAAEGFENGDGSYSNPYIIKTAKQLVYLSEASLKGETYSGKYLSLAADLDMSGHTWVPIKEFSGTLQGNNFTISNLTIRDHSSIGKVSGSCYGVGFIASNQGYVYNLNIKNLSVNVTYANIMCGGIAGLSRYEISGCKVSGSITVNASSTGTLYIGGIVGQIASGGIVTDCNCAVSITGSSPTSGASDSTLAVYTGGIAGVTYGNIYNCNSSGNISAVGLRSYAGGLVGLLNGWIWSSYSTANVTAKAGIAAPRAGGLAGMVTGGGGYQITDSYYAGGTVTATATGDNQSAYCGGLVGSSAGCVIDSCFATGTLKATTKTEGNYQTGSGYTGQLIGSASGMTVTNSYYSSSMSIQRTTTEAYDYQLEGCNAGTEKRYRHGTATTANTVYGSPTTDANFKTNSFITGTLGWSLYTNVSDVSKYKNVWLVNGSYPQLYREYTHSAVAVSYIGETAFDVNYQLYGYGDISHYTPKTVTGHSPDVAEISQVMTENTVHAVRYTPNQHRLIIRYRSAKDPTAELLPDYNEPRHYGERIDSNTDADLIPQIIGYTVQPSSSEIVGYMGDADANYTVYYDPDPCTITVKYVKKDGTEAAPTLEYPCTYDETYRIESPIVEGYTAEQAVVSGTAKGDKEITVKYGINPYKITVEYLYEDGTPAAETDVLNFEYGDPYEFYAKEITGCTPNVEKYSGTVGAQDVFLQFFYQRNKYSLEIHYMDAAGRLVADSYYATLVHGESYAVPSPRVPGYAASPAVAEGVMTGNTVRTVSYNKDPHTLQINYYDGDLLIGSYRQEYDYAAHYSVNTYQNVPGKYASYYSLVDETQKMISGIMPDNDLSIDVYFVRTTVASGVAGEGIAWTLYLDGELNFTIQGEGVMPDYSLGTAPWYSYKNYITDVAVQGSLQNIGSYAFADCRYLTNTEWLDGVSTISQFAFWGCSGMLELHIPASVVSIADGAFVNMTNLVCFVVDDSNPHYSDQNGILYAQDGSSLVAYPGGIRDGSVTVNTGVTEIGAYAFYSHKYVEEVILPQNLTKVGDHAFYGCAIETLIFEGNIVEIGAEAFAGGILREVYFKGDVPQSVGRSVFGESDVYIYYPQDNATWKPYIATEIVDQYKYYYWNGYRAYGISGISDVSLGYVGSLNLYAFRILYENDGTPIDEVTVTFNGSTKKTDPDGFVYFAMFQEFNWTYLTLSKEGYSSNYNTAYRYVLKPIGIDYLTLTDQASVQGVSCNGDGIANDKAYINTKYDGSSKIILQGNSMLEIAEMSIVQNGVILASSTDIYDDGRCIIEVPNGAFQKDAGEVYVYMLVRDGDRLRHAATASLNLILIAYDMDAAELASDFTSLIGDTFNGVTHTINGTGIPFLDGTKLKITPPELKGKAEALQKISVDCDNNQIFVTYNLDGYGDEWEGNTKQMQVDSYKEYVLNRMGEERYKAFCKDNQYVDKHGKIDDAAALKNIYMQDESGKMLRLDDFEISSDRKKQNFMSKLTTKTTEALEKKKALKNVDTTGKFSFDVELAGGFVVTFDENGHNIDPILQISVQLKASMGVQFVIAVINVPIVIDVTAKAEGTVTFTGMHLDFVQQKLELPDYVRLDLSGSITVSVGVGTRCFSFGVFGRITVETSIQLGGGDVYFDGLYLAGSVGIYAQAKILGFSVRWEKSWELFNTCVIKPRYASYGNLMMARSGDLSTYTVGSAIQRIENVKWTSDNTLNVVDDAYAYSNAKIAFVGDDLVMVYLDIVEERGTYNASTLMYKVYDFSAKQWGESREVDGNHQSESDFELLVAEDKLYIVYTESNCLFEDGAFPGDDSTEAMIETSKVQEIVVMTYDEALHAFGGYTVLTKDSYQDSTPVIGTVNNKVTVAWVKNTGEEASAVFGANYNNEIYVSSCQDGQWETPVCIQYGCGMIADLAVGETEDPTIAFIVDMDGDLYTDRDKSLYIYNMDKDHIRFYEKYDTYISNLQYVQVNGQKLLTWFENYNIAYTADGETVSYIFDEAVENLDSDYQLVEVTEDIYAAIWTVPGEKSSVVYASFRNVDGSWDAPMALFETSYYQMYMDVVSAHGDLKFVVASTQVNPDPEQLQMYSKIGFMSMTTGYGMSVSDVQMSAEETDGTMKLTATISNTSIKEIQNVAIYIKAYQQDENRYRYYVGGIYPVNLTAGESNTFEFSCDYIDGLDFEKCTLAIEVYEGTMEELEAFVAGMNQKEEDSGFGDATVNGTTTGGAGNSIVGGNVFVQEVTGSYGSSWGGDEEEPFVPVHNMKVEGEYIIIGSTEYLSVKVTNMGTGTSSGELRILQTDTNEIVYEAYVTDVSAKGTKYYLIKLNKDYFEETNATFICELAYGADENLEDNRCEILAYKVENAEIVPYDQLATAVELSTHNATFDKNGAEDVELEITLNGNEFEGIANVESGQYTTTPMDADTLKATISGACLKNWENGNYEIEFLFSTQNSWINSYLNLSVMDTTPIDLMGMVQIMGTLSRGQLLTVDVSKLDQFYDITYQWYVNDEPVSTDATYQATEEDLGATLRVEVASTGLIEGRLQEEYVIALADEYTVDISSLQASLQYRWFVGGEVVSEEPAYTVANGDMGKPIYVEVYGNGDYDGTIQSATYDIPKVVRSLGTPVLTNATGEDHVILGNLFLYGDGELYYGYSLTNDPNTVENWQKERVFTLSETGYHYFFAKATEGAVYAAAYSDGVPYLYKAPGWNLSGNITGPSGSSDPITIRLLQNGSEYAVLELEGSAEHYAFEEVPAGAYLLQVSKKNCVTGEYAITVENADLTQDIGISLLGDLTGDGKLNILDVARMYAAVKSGGSITDPMAQKVADYNGDGKLNILDVAKLYATIKSGG